MSHLTVEFYSNSLARPVSFKMLMPNDRGGTAPDEKNHYQERKTKVLFLLHGYTGGSYYWGYEELADKYNFAMVMPEGENSFYLDGCSTGHKYGTFVGEELVGYIRKTFGLAFSAEETYICGLSMGGFGALHTALAYPESFGKAGAMSSALIIHDIAHMKPGEDNGVANYDYYHECFGCLETVEQSAANPETLVDLIAASGGKMPEIYMCCGTEDFLLKNNRRFHGFLTERKVPHVYNEGKGGHDYVFWNEYTPKIIEWMFGEEK